MSSNCPYHILENYCLRTPLFPLSSYLKLVNGKKIQQKTYKSLLNQPTFAEALYLASPQLHKQIDKWKNQAIHDSKKIDKLKATVLKYYTRMSSRCTPFGLFAACSMGYFAEQTQITLSTADLYKRNTRLDMGYAVSLSKAIQNTSNINDELLYFTNNSIYQIHDHYRYLEYKIENFKRKYSLEGVAYSASLSRILKVATKGATKLSLAYELVDENVDIQEALAYINLLIDNQLLIAELDLVVIGGEYLGEIDNRLISVKNDSNWSSRIQKLKLGLKQIDNEIGGNLETYEEFAETAESFISESNPKHLFQTNVYATHTSNQLSNGIKKQLQVALHALQRMTCVASNPILEDFKNSFRERYETQEVALTEVLDLEFGIGYGTMPDHQDFLQDLSFNPFSTPAHQDIKWTPLDIIMQPKLFSALSENQKEIVISDEDLNQLPKSNANLLPDSFSTIIEVYDSHIYLNGFAGSSAINLLGRFCHGDQEILDHVKHIARLESEMHPNCILAEINHLPEARTGNVLHRPRFREFEIPYLNRSSLNRSKQLTVDDLYLSLRENVLVLKSKKYNKQVLPRMGNAHNYQHSNLPVYRFLCDLQTEGVQSHISFSWSQIYDNVSFLPRVTYKNLILSKSRWNINTGELLRLLKSKDPQKAINDWKRKHQLPNYVQLVEGDNLLLISLGSISSIEMLADAVKGNKRFTLEEFLFTELGNPVTDINDKSYCNQFIVGLYNHQKWSEAQKNKNTRYDLAFAKADSKKAAAISI